MNANGPDDTRFERRTRDVLDASAARLPAHVRSRLTRARHGALEELTAAAARPAWQRWLGLGRGAPRGGFGGWGFAPGGAVAAIAIVAVLLWSGRPGSIAPPGLPGEGAAVAATFEDIDLLADADALELAAEGDPEFVEWAALAAAASPDGAAAVGAQAAAS
jgi:hypothetical protein